MKIILTGSTGFIGGAVLARCLSDPRVTSIVALSRRELAVQDPKLKTIIMRDFAEYPESVLEELKGAEACIWCMGKNAADMTVTVEYPLAFVKAFSYTLSPQNNTSLTKPFRFLYLSGMFASQDQSATLYFFPDGRRAKGVSELKLAEFTEKTGNWSTVIVKPGGVWGTGAVAGLGSKFLGGGWTVRVDELAAAMVGAVVNPSDGEWEEGKTRTVMNAELITMGRKALGQAKG